MVRVVAEFVDLMCVKHIIAQVNRCCFFVMSRHALFRL